jgi:4'-phosphopantetheinyl transferase
MVKLFCTRTTRSGIPEDLVPRLLEQLPEAERGKITRLVIPQDRLNSLAGKLLLLWGLRQEQAFAGFPEIFRDSYGRPYQKQILNLDFNVSHSVEWVACGLSDCGRIGVDVERITDAFDPAVAARCFTLKEIAAVDHLAPTAQAAAYCRLWTLKEAYLKAEGSTFDIPLRAFEFDISNPDRPHAWFERDFPYPTGCQFRSYPLTRDYLVSVCVYSHAENVFSDLPEVPAGDLLKFGE